ncbi:MAG: Ig-like domain-containing protein [Clostridia bacterium]|nr:Ig-like domain-containing protein [Clostridia bacterium]
MKLWKILLAVSCLTIALAAAASAEVAVDKTNFPDAVFRREVTDWERYSGDGNGVLSDQELEAFTDLYLYGSVANLTGIKKLTGLTNVIVYDSPKLAGVDVSGMASLQELQVVGCGVKTIDVSGCTGLTYLNVSSCKLTALDVSSCKQLQTLYCNDNQLTELDLKGLTGLTALGCEANSLTELDVSDAPKLVECLTEAKLVTKLVTGKFGGVFIYEIDEWTSLYVDGTVKVIPEPTSKPEEGASDVCAVLTKKMNVTANIFEKFRVDLWGSEEVDFGRLKTVSVNKKQKDYVEWEIVKEPNVDFDPEYDDEESAFIDVLYITPLKEGKADITIKDDRRHTVTLKVTIADPNAPQSVFISEGASAEVPMEGVLQLNAGVVPETARKEITWKSSSAKIATVDENGQVKGIKAGTAVITATSDNGRKASIKVAVYDPTIPQRISIDQAAEEPLAVYLGKPGIQLTVSAEPSDTADASVTWKSAKTKIVKVASDGTLIPVKAGTAKITATSKKNKKIKTTITVNVIDLTVPAGIEITSETGESTVAIKGTLSLKAAAVAQAAAQDLEIEPVKTVTWKTGNK